MKKAQMQFNWAFVIVAGAVILGFFITFTVKYIDIQNMKEGAIIASDTYNTLLTLQTIGFKTDLEIPLSLITDLDFSCNKMLVGSFNSSVGLKKEFIFSPEKMRTSKLDVWIQSWKYPFKIANLFYLSSKEKKYYILYDPNDQKIAEFVNQLDFPKRFNVEKITVYPNNLDENSRVISFTNKDGDVKITPDENGKATINNKDYPLFGMPLVYGAIFSEDYPCILDKLMKKYLTILEIYKTKADYLYAIDKDCDYSQIRFTLNTLRDKIESKNYDEIKNYVNILNEQNSNLLTNDCSPLY